ncbi:glycoside hydrolase 43 family protein [Halalkalibacter sp. APA_J-10(15)]|uniref:glycoside hydrolase family 43 protein n=1 Tax=unclassified Halalkalibacter TaxID=2893063 RepID=UPI001FF69A61|nr:glycoside hydrolase 43 family protein [Halalkalibacter sp. APA_J-10(15)]MCK0470989.1 glycoside hydrolase 43 family protein [Halalkalibacter sp. APA_J-10(15)]
MSNTIITNPIIWTDIPDPSVIRVGKYFYMSSTSMHSMPGCPIMKSCNLKDWEIVNYVFDTFADNEEHRLIDRKNIYGKGSWATCLRYHNQTFYLCFSSNDTNQFYMYQTNDIENGEWECSVIPGLHHDPCLLFDHERVFVIHGNGDIRITELTEDATAKKEGGIDQVLLVTEYEGIGLRCEGCHAYHLNGYYYLFFIEWPKFGNKRRRQICYRSKELLGPYERRIVLDNDMGYQNQGVAQGGIVDTPHGEWYAFLFQDHGAVGRIPCAVPVRWLDNWPIFGFDGKVPKAFEAKLPMLESVSIVKSDEFNYEENKLSYNWQWNHNPNNQWWTVTARPGYLRLITGHLTESVEYARNTLTQRTEGPACSGMTLMDSQYMKPGDYAGIVALQFHFGTVGIRIDESGNRYVEMCVKGNTGKQELVESVRYDRDEIYLKMEFDFKNSIDISRCYYSDDGLKWTQIGGVVKLQYTLDHFMGCRIGLFNYATREVGGFADFDYFRYTKLNV